MSVLNENASMSRTYHEAMSSFSELQVPADVAAKRLLGCTLERTIDGKTLRACIVETEAYDENDPGSHTFRGPTIRNKIMFEKAGYLYVYFIYGKHFCCNVVTGKEGHGEAVLIRAVEPVDGATEMEKLRGKSGVTATNGPAKLCEALKIERELNGHNLEYPPLKLIMQKALPDDMIVQTQRIGLTHGIDIPWRFYVHDNPYVSKK